MRAFEGGEARIAEAAERLRARAEARAAETAKERAFAPEPILKEPDPDRRGRGIGYAEPAAQPQTFAPASVRGVHLQPARPPVQQYAEPAPEPEPDHFDAGPLSPASCG